MNFDIVKMKIKNSATTGKKYLPLYETVRPFVGLPTFLFGGGNFVCMCVGVYVPMCGILNLLKPPPNVVECT